MPLWLVDPMPPGELRPPKRELIRPVVGQRKVPEAAVMGLGFVPWSRCSVTGSYHISFDADHYVWRDAARNLPWITVIDPGGMSSDALVKYNVGTIPAFFIYDAGGELVDRASDFRELSQKL